MTHPATLAVLVLCLALIGCQHTHNPFVDNMPDVSLVTTASVEGVRAAPRQPSLPPRSHQPMRVDPQDGTVSHWPLWWEDPFEDKGSDDDRYAWTEEDYLCLLYGPGRFLLNTMAFPVSAWVTKPGKVLCSDGRLSRQRLGYDHDAIPCPGGTSPPIDILEIGTYHGPSAATEPVEPDAPMDEHPAKDQQ